MIEIRATPAPWWNGIELLIKDGNKYVTNFETKEIPEGLILESTTHINIKEAQVLMDDLWGSGIRPTEGAGSAGSLKATQYHLEDMRKLVFKTDLK